MKRINPDREIFPVEVFAGTSLQASMLKILLDNARVYSFLKNDVEEKEDLWSTEHEISRSVKVIVSSVDREEADKIVEKFVKESSNQLSVSG